VPEQSDFLEGDAPAADKVGAFLAQALAATGTDAPTTAGARVPWNCDALLSNHSVKAYGRDLMDFLRHMQAQGVESIFAIPGAKIDKVLDCLMDTRTKTVVCGPERATRHGRPRRPAGQLERLVRPAFGSLLPVGRHPCSNQHHRWNRWYEEGP
jgi:hypothetical protein